MGLAIIRYLPQAALKSYDTGNYGGCFEFLKLKILEM